jgi:hypothetical protein
LIEKLGEGASAKVFKGSFIVLLIEASWQTILDLPMIFAD